MVPEFDEMRQCELDSWNGRDLDKNEPDLPPEYCQYRDEGCDLADSCLGCPFPQCVYEQPGGKQRWLKKLRDREIARLFTDFGKAVKEIALMFGISPRTVQRALKNSWKQGQKQARGNTLIKGDLPDNE